MLSAVLDWLKAQKQTSLKMLLTEHTSSEEGKLILQNRQNFSIHQGALYLHLMPKGKTEDVLLFVVPRAHCSCPEGVSTRCRLSRAQPYPVIAAGMFSVARND